MHVRRALIGCLFGVIANTSVPVFAQSGETAGDPREVARSLFSDGVAALEQDAFDEAKELLSRSLEQYPHTATVYNLAVALQGLGELLAARELLGALRAGRYGELNERAAAPAAVLLADVQLGIASVDVLVTGSPESQLEVDGEERGATNGAQPRTLLELDPGRHVVRASTLDGTRSAAEVVQLGAGEGVRIELHIPPIEVADAPEVPVTQPAVDTEAPAGSSHRRRRIILGVVLSLVAVGAATGVGAFYGTRDRTIEDDVFGVTTTLTHR